VYLYSHIWKSFIRNERWRRNLITKILYALASFYFVFLFLTLGLETSLRLAKEGGDSAGKFHEWIVWYLLADYLVRCLVQPLPTMEVVPYLRFRIRKRKLGNTIIVRSASSLFNFLPLLIVFPFAVNVTGQFEGTSSAICFVLGCVMLIILNNMLALMTGMLTRINPVNWLIPAGIAGAIALTDKAVMPMLDFSRNLGLSLTEGKPVTFLVLAVLTGTSVSIIYRILYKYLRVDSGLRIHGIRAKSRTVPEPAVNPENREIPVAVAPSGRIVLSGRFSSRYDTLRYISLEVSMMVRNKRPRNTMLIVPFFLIYAVAYFLSYDKTGGFFNILFTTMYMGLGAISYGQLLFSWESTYFDGVMARKNNFMNYVRAKYYLQGFLTLVMFIPIAVLAGLTGKISLPLVTALMLFLLGPGSFLIMLLAILNDGKIDLNAGTFMNYQGVKGSQFIMTFLFVLIPVAVYQPIRLIAGDSAGILVLVVLGLLFVFFHKWWLEHIIVPAIRKRRYKLLEGYRKLSA